MRQNLKRFVCRQLFTAIQIAQNDASRAFGGIIPSFLYLIFRRRNANVLRLGFHGNKSGSFLPIQ